MAIDTKLIKELRDRTAAGMMDCKNALEATDGNIEAAIEWLREKGIAKAVKKAGRIAAEGLTAIKTNSNDAVIVEINSETDFVAQNAQFLAVVDTISSFLLANKPASVEAALEEVYEGKKVSDIIAEATAVIGEKIDLRRFTILSKTDSQHFGPYMHMGGKVSSLALLEGANEEVAKDVAMQSAALNPQFIRREDVDQEFIAKETALLTQQVVDEGKPENIAIKIVEGRLNKQLKEICLLEQSFIKDDSMTVLQYVTKNNGTVVDVIRYAVGEGIEKKQEDFAAEVMSQVR